MNKKVYYAHAISLYGTQQEQRDVATLEALGFEVINPNSVECQQGYAVQGMAYFARFAKECDLIAFRGLPDGDIPAGIAFEIKSFRDLNKPVIELPCSILRRTLDKDQTREYLLDCGHR
jgi:hypothetical protein